MLEVINYLNLNRKIFLNFSIIFFCLVILLHLFTQPEEEFESTGFIQTQIENKIDDFKNGLQTVTETVFPISPSFQTFSTIDDLDSTEETSDELLSEADTSIVGFVEIIQDRTVQDTFLKAVLTVLLSYLLITLACREIV